MHLDLVYRVVLVCIYSLVLVVGTAGLAVTIHILKSNMRPLITIAMLNLSLAHLLFLLTVPFRIYYYTVLHWGLGQVLCKLTSAMIHVHMYLAFVFYVVILVIRLLGFHVRKDRYEFYRNLHAFGASVTVWVLVCVGLLPSLYFNYGHQEHTNTTASTNDTRCFEFGKSLDELKLRVLNYIFSTMVVGVTSVLFSMQCHVIATLARKYGRDCASHQEFWAQLKSLFFAMVLLVCFVPYHVFRMHYLGNRDLEQCNEVFLSITALSCCDMLTFLARKNCNWCDGTPST